MRVDICKPYGYCNGVKKIIDTLKTARELNPNSNIFVLGDLIHNEHINEFLYSLKIKKINEDEIDNLSSNSIVILSAHGHAKELERKLLLKQINYIDGTCFNVNKGLNLINYYHDKLPIIFIGKKDHEETIASTCFKNVFLYDIKDKIDYSILTNNEYLITCQTSISEIDFNRCVEDIKKHVEKVIINDNICGIIKSRFALLDSINNDISIIIIVGSKTSSNATSLYNLAVKKYPSRKVCFINDYNDIDFEILEQDNIAIISSCSSSEESVNDLVNYLNKRA